MTLELTGHMVIVADEAAVSTSRFRRMTITTDLFLDCNKVATGKAIFRIIEISFEKFRSRVV